VSFEFLRPMDVRCGMGLLLLVLSLLSFGLGVLVVLVGGGAINSAIGILGILIAAVLLVGAAIVNAISTLQASIEARKQ